MTAQLHDAKAQSRYQVRFGVGEAALGTIAMDAGVIVWVNAIDAMPPALSWPDASVVLAGLIDRSAVARWVLDRQVDLGDRVHIAVIAATDSVPDTLAAGAVIDALAALGIDFSSPEAAVPCAAFVGLSRAVGHLVTASVVGQELLRSERAEQLAHSARVDSVDEVREVRRVRPDSA